MDELKNLLKKYQISLPSRMITSSSSSQSYFVKRKDHKDKGQALVAISSYDSGRWLLDSGASHYIASSQSMFSSFDPHHTLPILMSSHTYKNVIW